MYRCQLLNDNANYIKVCLQVVLNTISTTCSGEPVARRESRGPFEGC